MLFQSAAPSSREALGNPARWRLSQSVYYNKLLIGHPLLFGAATEFPEVGRFGTLPLARWRQPTNRGLFHPWSQQLKRLDGLASMDRMTFQTPVALFVFNRPDTTSKVFEAIAAVQPARLLLVADGPRPGKPGEAEACQHVRDIVTRVDWPCEVSTNFADKNLGCGERMISGLNWIFSLVEEAILLEDDCLPDPSFFPYCQELLERYRGDDRVAYISGDNLIPEHLRTDASYYFSRIGGIWGWATWRTQWQRYDRYLTDWPRLKRDGMLEEILDRPQVAYCTDTFDAMYENRGPDTWDHQWFFTLLKNNSAAAVPRVNLVANLGYGHAATHTTEPDPRFTQPATAIEFPLKHPVSFVPLKSVDRHAYGFRPTPFHERVARKIRRIVGRLFH